jgi:hypothetical protein
MSPKKVNKKKVKPPVSRAKSSNKKKTAKRVTKKPVEAQVVSLPPEPIEPKTQGFFNYLCSLFVKSPKDNES